MRAPAYISAGIALLPTLLFAADVVERPLRFATDGGDAWTFVRRVTLEAPPGACEAVWVKSPKGVFAARHENNGFTAGVSLAAGDNILSAECVKNGRVRGAAEIQHWNVRLTGLPSSEPTVDPSGGKTPAWARDAVVYGVVPWLFGPRGLQDVTARLDEIAALGITALWLSPVTAAPPGDFGYAVTDHFRLREDVGGEDDLRALIDAAHARHLRVLVDFVPNHFSDKHPYYRDVQTRGKRSPYFDFFARDASGNVVHYFDWENLENLNYDNPEVQRMIIEASARWVRDFHVDGFRVDAAWGPATRAPGFWPRWRAELKKLNPDLLLLAEATARDPYYFRNGFDAAYDWTDELGHWAWMEAFASAADSPAGLACALQQNITASLNNDAHHYVFRFLDNNDTGARFVTRYGLGATRVASAMLLTLPGVPSLYTGEETAAAFEPYRDIAPLPRDDPHGLRPWYAQLIALRHTYPALRSADLQFVNASGSNMLAYIRRAPEGHDDLLVVLNYAEAPAQFQLPAEFRVRGLRDLIAGEVLPGARSLIVPAYGVLVLKRE